MSESCVRQVSGRFFLNDSGLTVSSKNTRELNQAFLDHFLLSKQAQIYNLGRGSAQRNLDVKLFRDLNICFPICLEAQKRIVSMLDEAFAGIETAIANTERNHANARALFTSRRNSFFAVAPDSWKTVTLDRLCSIKHGFAFKSEHFSKKGVYVLLTPGSFHEHGGFRDQGAKTKYYLGEIPDGFLLEKDEFLIAMTEQAAGLLGSSLIVPESGKYLHNQRLGRILVKEHVDWHNDFLFHQFNTPTFRSAVQRTASGVKVRHTSPKKLCEIPVKIPPIFAEQVAVADHLNRLDKEAHELQRIFGQKIDALRELKQSLLQKAFSGELTADRAEREVESLAI